MHLSQWAEMNPQLAGVIVSVVIGPLIMLIASRVLSIKQVESPAGAPIAAPTSDVRAVLTEISASARMNAHVLDELHKASRSQGRDMEGMQEALDDNRRTLARHSNALDRIEDMLRHADDEHHPRHPRD